ncbi:hypothetical protein [Nitrosomonas ureae]|uniref:Nucleoside 2-deoxyribosyltransferase n=1 Tax=Nitrosomonas ureae TaxID=44577 RepID=A0A1H2DQE8_9PROT|nr:hypothetical protein [Nitrosomonas ureae]ALQ51010.1 hypothetical protein ATY38_07075 [Nitrosomonas ureae]SDT85036.1 hypothetical protein SAMN05216406_10339 [Nitrosomonas ureae]
MALSLQKLRDSVESLRHRSGKFFHKVDYVSDVSVPVGVEYCSDIYWNKLKINEQEESIFIQRELMLLIQQIGNSIRNSALVTEVDRRDLSHWTKSLRSSLRLRKYHVWDTEILHDEGHVLGVKPPGQSDENPLEPELAKREFDKDIANLLGLIDLIEVSPTVGANDYDANPQVTTEYRPGTAFVMMWIDPGENALEDIYETIKDCFEEFGIIAVRADIIEHEEIITARIIKEIESSEFLIADLTGERPSVYYEVGYAHSLGRRVILYRKQGTKIHFDLAAYNCPEYKNVTDLKRILKSRLEAITGRKANK